MSLEQTPPERQTTKYERLIEISLDLASTLDLDTLLIRIVGVACELSESEQSSILLYDETTQQLFFQTSTSIATHPDLRGMVVPVENSLAGWVVKHRQPVMVTNVKEDIRHFGVIDQSIQFSTHSLIGIPLVTQDKILGVLEVINKINGEYTRRTADRAGRNNF